LQGLHTLARGSTRPPLQRGVRHDGISCRRERFGMHAKAFTCYTQAMHIACTGTIVQRDKILWSSEGAGVGGRAEMAPTPPHHCNHDSPAFSVEDSTRAPQPYPDSHPHRRGLSSHGAGGWNSSALWEPLRINHTVTAMVNLTSAQESFLVDQLLPAAMTWVSSALRVVRSSSALHAQRTCFQEWPSNRVCGLERPSYCGVASDDYRVTIPQFALGGMTVCTASPSSGCSSSADGGGYPDADFVLYVTAAESRICTGAVLAYASTCVRDQFDRPVFGHANFCPSKLSAAPAGH
jgi:hypothetical protein